MSNEIPAQEEMTEEQAIALLEEDKTAFKRVRNVQATIHNLTMVAQEAQANQQRKIIVPGGKEKVQKAYLQLGRSVDELLEYTYQMQPSSEAQQQRQNICMHIALQGLEYVKGAIYDLHAQRLMSTTGEPSRINQKLLSEAIALLERVS